MKMRTRIASVVCAVAMTFGMGASAFAQATGTEDVVVEVTGIVGADVSYLLEEAVGAFPGKTFSFDNQQTTGDLTLTVTDNRGTATGWNLSVKAIDFDGALTDDTIPVDMFSLAPGTVTVEAGKTSPLPTASSVTMSTGLQSLFKAAADSGNGKYKVVFTGTVNIPGATLVDTYKTTITVDLSDAP